MKRYRVTLEAEERQQLHDLIAAGRAAAASCPCRILLKADGRRRRPRLARLRIADALEVSTATVERVRQRFVEQGLDAAWIASTESDRPERSSSTAGPKLSSSPWPARHPGGPGDLDHALFGRQAGRTRCRGSISDETVRLALKKRDQAWLRSSGGIPPQANAEFVAAMEDVRKSTTGPYDEKRPLSAWTSRASSSSRDDPPIPAAPGRPSGSTTSMSATA